MLTLSLRCCHKSKKKTRTECIEEDCHERRQARQMSTVYGPCNRLKYENLYTDSIGTRTVVQYSCHVLRQWNGAHPTSALFQTGQSPVTTLRAA